MSHCNCCVALLCCTVAGATNAADGQIHSRPLDSIAATGVYTDLSSTLRTALGALAPSLPLYSPAGIALDLNEGKAPHMSHERGLQYDAWIVTNA